MRRIALTLLMLLGAVPSARAESKWEEIKNEDGIRAFKREVEGSSLVEFLGRGQVKAPILHIAAVLRDSDREKEWMEDCNGSFIVQWISATHAFSYNRTKSPVFFIQDRDTVVESTLKMIAEKRSLLVTFQSKEHKKVPPIDGVVRMPEVTGHWLLTQVDPETTEVEYQVHADPGGSLPHWLVNWVSENLPWGTIARLREQVKKPGYDQHALVLEQALDWSAFQTPAPVAEATKTSTASARR
jgi:hypothetical protein